MILRYTDRSKDDVELAFAWYEKQRRGLGGALLEDFPSQYFTQLKMKKL